MISQFTITPDTARQLELRKAELEREMGRLREEHALVCKKLEAVPLFLEMTNGHRHEQRHEGGHGATSDDAPVIAAADTMSIPMAVKCALGQKGRLAPIEVREAVKALGVPASKMGIGYSYLYTTLRRLQDRGEIQKVRGKYQLPPGVTHNYVPSEDDLKAP